MVKYPACAGCFHMLGNVWVCFSFPGSIRTSRCFGGKARVQCHDSKKRRFTQTSPHLGIVAASWQRPYTTSPTWYRGIACGGVGAYDSGPQRDIVTERRSGALLTGRHRLLSYGRYTPIHHRRDTSVYLVPAPPRSDKCGAGGRAARC
jgi:hypothetical protein